MINLGKSFVYFKLNKLKSFYCPMASEIFEKSKLFCPESNCYLNINEKSSFLKWKKIKQHWIKNRKIFYLIFNHMNISLNNLRILEKKKRVDLNLILMWTKSEYINLCSTFVVIKKNMEKKMKFHCTKSLFKRPINQIFLIEKSSGCICCSSNIDKDGPIWWNEFYNIGIIFDVSLKRFISRYLYSFSILKTYNFLFQKNLIFFRKTTKLFNVMFINFSIVFCEDNFDLTNNKGELINEWLKLY